jgi:hypothetical protein
VPIVDADWNEKDDIRKYELQAFLKWFVGNGVPAGNNGFHIHSLPDRLPDTEKENDFLIRDGICLVEGWDVINNRTLRYTGQRLYEDDTQANSWGVEVLPALTIPETDRTDTVYLDVWEREVTATDDYDHLVNEAIGIETCTRLKREWVVRVAEGQTETELPTPPEGHVYYPLASLSREANQLVIRAGDITNLRQTGLNMAALEAEIAAARGIKTNLGSRLDESLTEEGKLRPNVVGSDQIADDAVNNTNVEPNSLIYDKLRGELIDFEITVAANDTTTADVGAPDAFRLVSVDTNGQVDWHFRSGLNFPVPIPRAWIVLQNNGAANVTVRVRAYVFSDPA